MSWRRLRAVPVLWAALTLASLPQLGCNKTRSGSAAPATARVALAWPLRQVLSYQLDLESSSSLSGGATPEFELSMQAMLTLIPVEQSGKRVAVLMRLLEPRLKVAGQRSPEAAGLETELGKPFWLAFEGGRIVDSRVPEAASPQAVSIWRSVAGAIQLAEPPASAASWQAQEHDATGLYDAKYESSRDGQRVTKHKLRFVQTLISGKANADQRRAVLPDVVASSAELTLAGGLLERLRSKDELRSTLLGSQQVTGVTRLTLERQAGAPPPASAPQLRVDEKLVRLPPDQAYGRDSVRAEFDALRAGNATFAEVLPQLERLEQADPHAAIASVNDQPASADDQAAARGELTQRADLLSQLTGLLRTRPETVTQVQQAIAAHSPAASALADALGMADKPDAQAALIALAGDARSPRDQRLSFATSLIRARTPSVEMVRFLSRSVHDPLLADHGVYGLGTASRHLREAGEHERSRAIDRELAAGLQASSTLAQRIRYLRGIANAASVNALPVVLPLVQDKEPSVRQAAMEAIRYVDDERVDRTIEQRLRDETDVAVRRAIATLCQVRKPEPRLVAAVTQVAKSDGDRAVRAAALRVLQAWQRQRPELSSVTEPLRAAAAAIAADDARLGSAPSPP